MGRKKLIRTDSFPYHVISRSRNKEWYKIPLEEVWDISFMTFESVIESGQMISVHSYVLMNNHYHMLISTPQANIDIVMRIFNKTFSNQIRVRTKRINQIFGGRYRWSIVNQQQYLYNIYRYIYQNPLRAKICHKCEDYPFSSYYYQK